MYHNGALREVWPKRFRGIDSSLANPGLHNPRRLTTLHLLTIRYIRTAMKRSLLAVAVVSLFAIQTIAQAPRTISHQGRLADNVGQPLTDSTWTISRLIPYEMP